MAYVRMHEKNAFHFITNRTEHEMFLLLPTTTVVAIISEWFTKAMALYGGGIELYAVVFMSNHFHLLCRDTEGNLARFMCYMQANIAKSINKLLGRKGKFWSGHYDDMIIEGDNSFLNRFAYTCCNPVEAGLVDRCEQWLGFNGLENVKTAEPITASVFNKTKYLKASRNRKRKPDKKNFFETFSFNMAIPPMWQGKSQAQIDSHINELIRTKERQLRKERRGKPALDMHAVLSQKPTDRPEEPANSPRVRFMADTKDRAKELHSQYREFNGMYREIWGQFQYATQSGRRSNIEWPAWSYPPSQWRPQGYEQAA